MLIMSFKAILLIVLSIFCVDNTVGREVVRWIESPRLTTWGDWGTPEYCGDNQFVSGIELKIEGALGEQLLTTNDDDTALNGVRLICTDINGSNPSEISSLEGKWGEYRGKKHCENGIATGFTLRSEPDQNSGDDVAAVDMKLKCSNVDGSTSELIGGGVLTFGDWTQQQSCPPETAVCGIKTQVESHQGNGDDSALNNVDLACCRVPHPAKVCQAETKWETLIRCQDALECAVTYTTGLIRNEENSNTVSESVKFYRLIGFTIGGETDLEILKANIKMNAQLGTEIVNGKSVSDIVGETGSQKEEVFINSGCDGALQELVVKCGIYLMKTKEYRCLPDYV